MSKGLLLLFLLSCSFTNSENESIYSISFKSIDNKTINMKEFVGKKIMIYAFNAGSPNIPKLKALDSIGQINKSTLVIIGIPVNDFEKSFEPEVLNKIISEENLIRFPISAISRGKSAPDQHNLLRWLSRNSLNNHFKKTFLAADQLYLISTQGNLYGVFDKGFSVNNPFMNSILKNEPIN